MTCIIHMLTEQLKFILRNGNLFDLFSLILFKFKSYFQLQYVNILTY